MAASAPDAHAAGSAQLTRVGSVDPRTNAAASRMMAIAVTASAVCQDSQRPRLTPVAGGAMPRPK